MAFINKEEVKVIRNDLKKEFPEMKFSVRMRHHSSVNVTILKAPYDFELNGKVYRSINEYHFLTDKGHFNEHRMEFETANKWVAPLSDEHKEIIKKVFAVITKTHWDKSDIQSDYFNCAFYYNLSIGSFEKTFTVAH